MDKKNKALKKEFYVVQSLGLMNYLCANGFRVHKFEESRKNPGFQAFIFKDSFELRKCITTYTKNKKGHR